MGDSTNEAAGLLWYHATRMCPRRAARLVVTSLLMNLAAGCSPSPDELYSRGMADFKAGKSGGGTADLELRYNIPVDQLDLPATARTNRQAGIEFSLPGGGR